MDFDEQAGHKYFSVSYFNRAWKYIDLSERSPQQEEEMCELAMASLAHWRQRKDCEPRNLSIGCWQVSRVFALAGDGGMALRYGQRCLEHSQDEEPFYRGYANEALARASHVAGETSQAKQYLSQAYNLAAQVPDPEERQQLEDDLDALGSVMK